MSFLVKERALRLIGNNVLKWHQKQWFCHGHLCCFRLEICIADSTWMTLVRQNPSEKLRLPSLFFVRFLWEMYISMTFSMGDDIYFWELFSSRIAFCAFSFFVSCFPSLCSYCTHNTSIRESTLMFECALGLGTQNSNVTLTKQRDLSCSDTPYMLAGGSLPILICHCCHQWHWIKLLSHHLIQLAEQVR